MEGETLKAFIRDIATALTTRFRYEISMLNERDSQRLSSQHYHPIMHYLERQAAGHSTAPTRSDVLLKELLGYIDPDPINSIERLIKNYKDGWEASISRITVGDSREEFFEKIRTHLKLNANIDALIHKISLKTLFGNDLAILEGRSSEARSISASLYWGDNDPLLRLKTIYPITPSPTSQDKWLTTTETFKKPALSIFVTPNTPMEEVVQDIVLLLMRLRVKQMIEDENHKLREKKILKGINELHAPTLTPLLRRIETLESENKKLREANIKVDNRLSTLEQETKELRKINIESHKTNEELRDKVDKVYNKCFSDTARI